MAAWKQARHDPRSCVRRIKGIALRAAPMSDRGFKRADPSGVHQARPCPQVTPSGRGAGPESYRHGMPEFGKEEETPGRGRTAAGSTSYNLKARESGKAVRTVIEKRRKGR